MSIGAALVPIPRMKIGIRRDVLLKMGIPLIVVLSGTVTRVRLRKIVFCISMTIIVSLCGTNSMKTGHLLNDGALDGKVHGGRNHDGVAWATAHHDHEDGWRHWRPANPIVGAPEDHDVGEAAVAAARHLNLSFPIADLRPVGKILE